ncbi:MAG TPA: aminodeoxychorismate/anthranilate synthase component II [Firmicutes bacterium]|nr:aminodeoxychorismate/anthranilate synthase component II [Bacillota bacterium]
MWLLLDNYDSFTYNLAQYLEELDLDVKVVRNDAITISDIYDMAPEAIVISPGPGRPEQSGISLPTIDEFGARIPILGVCLGHQAIAAAYGGEIIQAPVLMHGKVSSIYHEGHPLFHGVPNPFSATRYHSLIVRRESMPKCLNVIAQTSDGLIMAIAHSVYPVFGVQFHPESALTRDGKTILSNFKSLVEEIQEKRAGRPRQEVTKQ